MFSGATVRSHTSTIASHEKEIAELQKTITELKELPLKVKVAETLITNNSHDLASKSAQHTTDSIKNNLRFVNIECHIKPLYAQGGEIRALKEEIVALRQLIQSGQEICAAKEKASQETFESMRKELESVKEKQDKCKDLKENYEELKATVGNLAQNLTTQEKELAAGKLQNDKVVKNLKMSSSIQKEMALNALIIEKNSQSLFQAVNEIKDTMRAILSAVTHQNLPPSYPLTFCQQPYDLLPSIVEYRDHLEHDFATQVYNNEHLKLTNNTTQSTDEAEDSYNEKFL